MAAHIPGLDFEKPIIELERKIDELKGFTSREDLNMSSEVKKLEAKLSQIKKEVYENLRVPAIASLSIKQIHLLYLFSLAAILAHPFLD